MKKIVLLAVIFLMISGLIFIGCGAAINGGDEEEEGPPIDFIGIGFFSPVEGKFLLTSQNAEVRGVDINTFINLSEVPLGRNERLELKERGGGELIPMDLLSDKLNWWNLGELWNQPKFLKANTNYEINLCQGEKILKQFFFSTGETFTPDASRRLFKNRVHNSYPLNNQELAPLDVIIMVRVKTELAESAVVKLLNGSEISSSREIKDEPGGSLEKAIALSPAAPLSPGQWYQVFYNDGEKEVNWNFKTIPENWLNDL